MPVEGLNVGSSGEAIKPRSGFDVFEDYYKEPFNDGYHFGDVIRSLGRLTRFAEFVGKDENQLRSEMPDVMESLQGSMEAEPSMSDAFSYGNMAGSSAEEKLNWLIKNDPENARGWVEQMLGMQAERENTQDARAYSQYMDNTRVQRTMKDLEAAGINPILAYQYLGGSSSSVGAAGYPDVGVSTQALQRETTNKTTSSTDKRTAMTIVAALIALAGVVIKAKAK